MPPPQSWDEFEDMCCLVWGREWKDANTKRHGRSGQKQAGVDVYGQKDGKAEQWMGVQCKGKDNNYGHELTEKEIDREIKKAKKFRPQLKEFIFATTTPRNTKVEAHIRKKSDESAQAGSFRIGVAFWEDIVLKLKGHRDLLIQFDYEQDPGFGEMKDVLQSLKGEVRQLTEAQQQSNPDFQKMFDTWIGQTDKLLEKGYISATLELLQAMEQATWDRLSPLNRYMLQTKKASADLQMDKTKEAAEKMIDALQYNPENENALANAGLGHLILGDFGKARELAERAIAKNAKHPHANSVLIQSSRDRAIDDILSSLDPALLTETEVALAICKRYQLDDRFEEAEKWMRTAIQNNKGELLRLKAMLAEMILISVVKGRPVLEKEELTFEERKKFEEVKGLLEEVYARVSGELQKNYVVQIRNLSLINRSLGNYEDALKYINICLEMDGNSRRDLVIKGEMLRLLERNAEAIALYKGFCSPADTDQAPLIYGDILREEKRFDEALEIAEAFMVNNQGNPDAELLQQAKMLLVEIYIGMQDYAAAKKINDEELLKHPRNIHLLVNAARIAKMTGDVEGSEKRMDEARNSLRADAGFHDVRLVADTYYFSGKYAEAADLYTKIADVKTNNILVQRQLNSYYRSGRRKEALEMCRQITEMHGRLPFVSEVESEIHEHIGDLKTAISICVEYLERYPSAMPVKLRLARLYARSRDAESLRRLLMEPIDVSDLDWEDHFLLAYLIEEVGRHADALDMAYEARRKFHKDPEAHLAYIMFFLQRNKSHDENLIPKTVALNTAVCIEDGSGEKEWYIIENIAREEPLPREIRPSDHLAVQIMGKKPNDTFLLIEDKLSTETGKILSIQSKYGHAFAESQKHYSRLRPKDPAFRTIFVGDAKKGELPPAFEKILNQVDERRAFFEKIDAHYQSGHCTIGAIGSQTRSSVLDAWHGLVLTEGKQLLCSNGRAGELEAASALASSQRMPVIDPTALLTIFHIGAQEAVAVAFKKIGIAQTTIDLLNHKLTELRRMPPAGHIGGHKDPYTAYPDETIRQEIKKLEEILDWTDVHCKILPCHASLKLSKEERDKLDDILGDETVDTILIASENDRYLFSDDLILRILAKKLFKVEGVWTQGLLWHLLQKEKIEQAAYSGWILDLIRIGYVYISIDEHALLLATEQANWQSSKELTALLEILRTSEENSVIRLIVNFLYQLSHKKLLTPFQRETVIVEILNAAGDKRDRNKFVNKLIVALSKRLMLLQVTLDEMTAIILAWRQSRL